MNKTIIKLNSAHSSARSFFASASQVISILVEVVKEPLSYLGAESAFFISRRGNAVSPKYFLK